MSRRWAAQHLLDLGDGRARLKRIPPTPEADLSTPLKKLLTLHHRVAWAMRVNTGKGFLLDWQTMQSVIGALGGQATFEARFGRPRWIEFGTPGASDFVGQIIDSRTLAIESKPRPYVPSQVSTHQRAFLATVNKYGGLGIVADDIRRVHALLSGHEEPVSSGYGYFV